MMIAMALGHRTDGGRAVLVSAVVVAAICGACLAVDQPSGRLIPAFPGAQGYGAYTPGGRGGQVYRVTTLADYGEKEPPIPGSLRLALEAAGPRIVVFAVAGTIDLKRPVTIIQPFLTVAGQSAPGGGVCLKDFEVWIGTHDVVIRHLRFRLGDHVRSEQDALSMFNVRNVILDHCSISWSIDEVCSAQGDTHDLTIQWCMIYEGLSRSLHSKGVHSMGSILSGAGGVSVHHCLYAHNNGRNPKAVDIVLDFRNNVVYDWGHLCGYANDDFPVFVNYIANYFKAGPDTSRSAAATAFLAARHSRAYLADNILDGDPAASADNRLLVDLTAAAREDYPLQDVLADEPFATPPVQTGSAKEAYEQVLAGAGATLPARDGADRRLVQTVRQGIGGLIDSQDQVGGWPELEAGVAATDADADGMSDDWEKTFGLASDNPADGNLDADTDGYTNIEEYLNGTNPRLAEAVDAVEADQAAAWSSAAVEFIAQAKAVVRREQEQARARRPAELEALVEALRPKVRLSSQPGPQCQRLTIDLGQGQSIEMIRIPAGTFLMGSAPSEGGEADEHPQHKVTLTRPFYMSATAVTKGQMAAVMGVKPDERNPLDLPVDDAVWFLADEFCQVLSRASGQSVNLPTEAQWEYACRAGTTTAFNTGDRLDPKLANFNCSQATPYNPAGEYIGHTVPVRSFPPNAWGLYEMHGNFYEWCRDWYGPLPQGDPVDPTGPRRGGRRVMRGGMFSSQAFYCRSADRYNYEPGVGYGLRIVMESP